MLRKFRFPAFAAFLVLALGAPALAQTQNSEYAQGPGGYYRKDDGSGPYAIRSDGAVFLRGGPNQGAANVATSQTVASTTASQIAASRPNRAAVTIMNLGTTPVYVGLAGVTTTTGFLLPGALGASVTIPTSAAVFGVVATGTQGVAILETY